MWPANAKESSRRLLILGARLREVKQANSSSANTPLAGNGFQSPYLIESADAKDYSEHDDCEMRMRSSQMHKL
jgi:hypothetical protein